MGLPTLCKPLARLGRSVQKRSYADLPFDVWFVISQYLSVKDICILQATSRLLRSLLGTRCVWHTVLRDISEIRPVPYLVQEMPSMSTADLRQACIRTATLDRAVSTQSGVSSRLISDFNGEHAIRTLVLPGGERYVTTTAAGDLRFYVSASEKPWRTLAGPEDVPVTSELRMLVLPSKECIVLHALHWSNEPLLGTLTHIEFRVYHVRDRTVRLIKTIRPENARHIVHYSLALYCGRPTIAYLRGRDSRAFIVRITTLDEEELSLTLRLLDWVAPSYMQHFVLLFGSITLLADDRLLLATATGLYLYRIPPLKTSGRSWASCSEPPNAKPIWCTRDNWTTSLPLVSTPVRYGHLHHRARCMVWTGHDVHQLDIPLGDSDISNIRYKSFSVDPHHTHKTLQCFGHSYAIQCLDRNTRKPSSVFLIDFASESERATRRLDRRTTGFLKTALAWEGVEYYLTDMAFDEVSGRIAILEGEGSLRRLKVFSIL